MWVSPGAKMRALAPADRQHGYRNRNDCNKDSADPAHEMMNIRPLLPRSSNGAVSREVEWHPRWVTKAVFGIQQPFAFAEADVGYWHLADILDEQTDVRF